MDTLGFPDISDNSHNAMAAPEQAGRCAQHKALHHSLSIQAGDVPWARFSAMQGSTAVYPARRNQSTNHVP